MAIFSDRLWEKALGKALFISSRQQRKICKWLRMPARDSFNRVINKGRRAPENRRSQVQACFRRKLAVTAAQLCQAFCS